jgi:phosphohistidine phosphatase
MKLFLMRHAEAETGEQLDPTRGLTGTGKAQAKLMGRWLKRQAGGNSVVLESNMRRSIQTAKRVSNQLDAARLRSHKIDPDAAPEEALAEMQRQGRRLKADNVIAVSHGELLGRIAALLTGAGDESVHFAPGAAAHFEPTGRATEAKGEYYYEEVPKKRLILGDGGKSGNCDFCSDAGDLGWIDDGDVFEGPDGDVDEPPLHPNCTCNIERADRRVRVYAADRKAPEGVRLYEARRPQGKLHWLITPDAVARMEGGEDLMELALDAAEAALVLS